MVEEKQKEYVKSYDSILRNYDNLEEFIDKNLLFGSGGEIDKNIELKCIEETGKKSKTNKDKYLGDEEKRNDIKVKNPKILKLDSNDDWRFYSSTLNLVDDLIYISEILRKYSDEKTRNKVTVFYDVDALEFY